MLRLYHLYLPYLSCCLWISVLKNCTMIRGEPIMAGVGRQIPRRGSGERRWGWPCGPHDIYKKKSNILNHTNICVTTVTSLRCHPESVPFLLEIALDGSICNSYGDEWFVFSQKKRIVVAFWKLCLKCGVILQFSRIIRSDGSQILKGEMTESHVYLAPFLRRTRSQRENFINPSPGPDAWPRFSIEMERRHI
jgi:hypothetical protein